MFCKQFLGYICLCQKRNKPENKTKRPKLWHKVDMPGDLQLRVKLKTGFVLNNLICTFYPKEMWDTPPGGAWTLTEVWAFSSAPAPSPVIISLPFLCSGGGLDCPVGSLKTCDFCRASWWGLTTCGFLGSGSKDGFGAGWLGSPKTLDCCRLCWLTWWWVGVGAEAGASEPKTLDLFRAAWQALTSFFGGSGGAAESLPNKLIEVLPPGGARTLKCMI